MDIGQLTQLITEQILKKLKNEDALVIIDTSPFYTCEYNINIIKKIHDQRGIGALLCIEHSEPYLSLEKDLGIDIIHDPKKALALVKNARDIYIPGFTISNGAKIRGLIADNLVTQAVQHALLNGVNIYVTDILKPINKGIVSDAYLKQIMDIQKALIDYGIRIIGKGYEPIDKYMLEQFDRPDKHAAQYNHAPGNIQSQKDKHGTLEAPYHAKSSYTKTRKKIITSQDIKDISTKTIKLDKDTIVTPLAVDCLKEKGIDIIPIKKIRR